MENKLTFTVTIEFNKPLSPAHIKEVAQAIAQALVNDVCNGYGIVPEIDDDVYTTNIQVTPAGSTETVTISPQDYNN